MLGIYILWMLRGRAWGRKESLHFSDWGARQSQTIVSQMPVWENVGAGLETESEPFACAVSSRTTGTTGDP